MVDLEAEAYMLSRRPDALQWISGDSHPASMRRIDATSDYFGLRYDVVKSMQTRSKAAASPPPSPQRFSNFIWRMHVFDGLRLGLE